MVSINKSSDSELRMVKFEFTAGSGHKVALAGSFNDWEQEVIMMEYSETTGRYSCEIALPCGTYEYKLVIDGEWETDPDNQNFAANDFGTLNSVVIVG